MPALENSANINQALIYREFTDYCRLANVFETIGNKAVAEALRKCCRHLTPLVPFVFMVFAARVVGDDKNISDRDFNPLTSLLRVTIIRRK